MFKTKAEVDKHVENCLNQINCEKERIIRGFNFAKLYFNVGNYELAKTYISSYLSVRPNSSDGHRLLGSIYEKLGKRELALASYKISLNLEPKQSKLVMKVCELLSENIDSFDPTEARTYCHMGEIIDPKNPSVNTLKEKLLLHNEENCETIIDILRKEIEINPTNVNFQIRLLKIYVQNNKLEEAYKHVIDIEERNLLAFSTNSIWYETIAEVLIGYKNCAQNIDSDSGAKLTWSFWCLFMSVLDKLLSIKLNENENDYTNQLFIFDQTLYDASKFISKVCPDRQLLTEFLRHFSGQLYLHYATVLFKNAKRDLIQFKEVNQITLPLLFAAYHAKPVDLQSIWINHLQDGAKKNLNRWFTEASFRCSQSGHILNTLAQNQKSVILSKASQLSTGIWQEMLYKKVFVVRHQQLMINSSYFVNNQVDVVLKLPSREELLKFDEASFHSAPNVLNQYVWVASNQNLIDLTFEPFVGLPYSVRNLNNCGAETLNLLDVQTFIYAATLCAKAQQENLAQHDLNRPKVLPLSVTGNLCTKEQERFLVAAYRMYKNETNGTDSGEIRLTLIRGIEVIRCVKRHGLDASLLVKLAKIFAKKAKKTNKNSEIDFNEARAELYWKTALPLLQKLSNNQAIIYAPNRLFEYKGRELTYSEIISNIEKGKLFIGSMEMKRKNYEKALNIFEELKDPFASYYQSQIYKQMAEQEHGTPPNDLSRNQIIFLSKSRDYLYLTLDRLREPSVDKDHPLNVQLGTDIEGVERMLAKLDSNVLLNRNCDGMSDSSEENVDFNTSVSSKYSTNFSERLLRGDDSFNNHLTPIREKSGRKEARPSLERLDAQMRKLMLTGTVSTSQIAERDKIVMDSLRNITDEMRDLKGYITDQVEQIRNDMKNSISNVEKKILNNFKKEVNELVKLNSYVLDDEYQDYGANVNSGIYQNYQSRLPQNLPPPASAAAAAAAAALYPHGLYSGLYGSIPPYGYPNLGLQQSSIPYGVDHQLPLTNPMASVTTPSSSLYQQQQLPQAPSVNLPTSTFNTSVSLTAGQSLTQTETKNALLSPSTMTTPSKVSAAPVNVVITSSDPLPVQTTSVTQPVLSVTIPPQHIKGGRTTITTQPHNYQIPLPVSTSTVTTAPSVLSKPAPSLSNTESILSNVAPPIYSAVGSQIGGEIPSSRIEPDEVILFECPAKIHLFQQDTKGFVELGIGLFDLLENRKKNTLRIFMKNDTGKILANHFITKDLEMASTKDNAYYWSGGKKNAEKFCLKFLNAEDARRFDVTLEKIKQNTLVTSTPMKNQFGGFVFSTSPALKTIESVAPSVSPQSTSQSVEKTQSPFANFSFSRNSTESGKLSLISKLSDVSSKIEESVEDFVPTAEFQPVIPLPDIVEVKTGEEDAEVLFDGRAKLLRFDAELKEWKERGLGNMKILKEKTLIRLLMRREQIHKVCCNHQLLKTMNFQYMPNNLKALTWCAQDFADEILKTETFAIRFKTEEQANEFLKKILFAQSILNENNLLESSPQSSKKPEETTGFGNKFKPEIGSWECKSCYITNKSDTKKCLACETPKESEKSSGFGDKFKPETGSWECKSCYITNKSDANKCLACETPKESEKIQNNSWGDKFKMKPGSWECKECFVRNESDVSKCISCETLKDGAVKQEATSGSTLKGVNLDVPFKFNFGIPSESGNTTKTTTSTSIVSTTTAFKFGASVPTSFTFGSPKIEASEKKESFVFGSSNSHEFEFKPRSPRKSVGESSLTGNNENEESEGSYLEEESDNIYFKPVIPLPDKVEVKTGEEDEEILYCHRAKLFRFVNGEWRERGLGDLKILKNKSSGKVRVLMRREQVLKICLNHALTENVEYLPKDEKTWLFTAPDFSEGEIVHEQFCLRFKTKEIAEEFKEAVTKALELNNGETDSDNNDVEFVSETKVTPEEKDEAEKLQLPSNFFAYRQLPFCECDQCKKDDEYFRGTIFDDKKNNQNSLKNFSFLRQTQNDISASSFNNSNDTSAEVSSTTTTSGNLFGSKFSNSTSNSIFGSGSESKSSAFSFTNFNQNNDNKSLTSNGIKNLFGVPAGTQNPIFGNSTTSIFGNSTSIFDKSPSVFKTENTTTSTSSIFSSSISKPTTTVESTKSPFGSINTGSLFGTNTSLFGSNAKFEFGQSGTSIFGQKSNKNVAENEEKRDETGKKDEIVFQCKSDVSFASLASQQNVTIAPEFMKKNDADVTHPFAFLGAGAPVFGSTKKQNKDKSSNLTQDSNADGDEDHDASGDNYDPHYEPIIPMPDAIVVSTGEEDENVVFNERAKLFRYDADLKEWKERGVGQMKILNHPVNGTYRFLLRREQVHKVVLNQLITPNLELQPMSTSDKAWVWAGHNFVEDETRLEKLAIRFKTQELAKNFQKSVEDVLKILKEKPNLPASIQNYGVENVSSDSDQQNYDEDDPYDEDYEGERTVMFSSKSILSEFVNNQWIEVCSDGEIQVYYDPEIYCAKISYVTVDGAVISNSVIGVNTVMTMEDKHCTWKSVELSYEEANWRILRATFDTIESSQQFYDNYLEGISYAQEWEVIDDIPGVDNEEGVE